VNGGRTRVKFCGCTSPEDAAVAVALGVDAIGMIFAPSPRQVTINDARSIAQRLAPFVTPVGVFVDPSPDDVSAARAAVPGLVVQLSGDESPAFVKSLGGATIKAIHLDPTGEPIAAIRERANAYPQSLLLFDTRTDGLAGGSGRTFAWNAIEQIAAERPVLIAGGLTAQNVGACIRAVRPYAVDVRSGIETNGAKDATKMIAFLAAVAQSDAA
jgi:phosphoribosylanthranilate isomerase